MMTERRKSWFLLTLRRWPLAVTIAAVGFLTLWPVFTARPGGLWITDDGNKWMVVENLLRHGTFSIVNPAAALDPDNQLFPDAVFHFQHFRGGIRSIFPEFFPLVSAPFYRLAGWGGLLILPVLGTWLALALTARLARSWRLRAEWLPLAAFLCTPLWFYSGTFWEMTLGVPFVLGALLLAGRGRWWVAGAVLAAGLWFRPEMYFAAMAAALALATLREWRGLARAAAGFVAAAIPFWIWQCVLYGNPLGLHGAGYYFHNEGAAGGFAATLAEHLSNYGYYWFAGAEPAWLTALLYLLAAILGWARGRRWIAGKLILVGIAWLGTTVMLNSEPPIIDTIGTVGLLSGQPFLMIVLLNGRTLWCSPNRPVRLAARIALFYLLIVPPLLTSSDLGIIWGPRHFLFVLPVLVGLAFYAARRVRRGMGAALAVLLVVAVCQQVYGVTLRERMKDQTAELAHELDRLTKPVVVSDVFFHPMLTPERFFDRQWLYLNDDSRVPLLLERLKRGGVREFSLVISAIPAYRRLSNDGMAQLLREAEVLSMEKVELPCVDFLNLYVFTMRLREP